MIEAYSVVAVAWSPIPGTGSAGGHPASRVASIKPDRAQ
jgi:hypothetical protein